MALSGAAFGALAIFAKVAYAAGADPVTVLAVRFAVAGACLLVLLRLRRQRLPRGRALAALLVLGGVGYVTQSLSYFFALTMASATLVALLLYVYPAIVTVVAAVFMHERLTRLKIAAVGVALAGTVLTIGPLGGGRPLGIVLGLVSALAYATYILVSAQVVPHVGALPATTVVVLAAAASLGVITAVRGANVPEEPVGWVAIVGLALVSTVLAIGTFFAGVSRIGPSEASIVSTFEPVVTVALATAVLGESLSPLQLLGGILIIAAVIILAVAGQRPLVPDEAPPA